jgi:phosphonate transport system ATP-binding protein
MAPLLYDLDGVVKQFGRHPALCGVALRVRPGEHVAFLGPSGAGKTTLFRVMNLTLRPSSGVLHFGGIDVARCRSHQLRDLRRRIGTIYQQHNLVGCLTVMHNVLAGHLGRWSTAKGLLSLVWPRELESAVAALARVGLRDKVDARTDTLSGGQQQRVAIARVLVQDPDVILADEPVSSVDPSLAQSIVRLLVDLSRTHGKTLLMNLHSVDLAMGFFPRVVGIRDGRVAFDLGVQEVGATLLAGLYAGAATDVDASPVYERLLAVRHACRGLPVAK